MAEYIEREAAMTTPVLPKEYRKYQTDNLDDAYEQGWMDALDNLKNAPAVSVPQLISVKDRQPENKTRNIVLRYDNVTKTHFVDILWFCGNGWFCNPLGFGAEDKSVSCWMPLPEPPKGENDE